MLLFLELKGRSWDGKPEEDSDQGDGSSGYVQAPTVKDKEPFYTVTVLKAVSNEQSKYRKCDLYWHSASWDSGSLRASLPTAKHLKRGLRSVSYKGAVFVLP